MTKYIDRYYLNWELYGIKFAEPGWQPGANTVAYYPLNWDILDHKGDYWISWTTYNLSVVVWTPAYVSSFESGKVAFNSQASWTSTWWCTLQASCSAANFTWDFTISFCARLDANTNDYATFVSNRIISDFKWMCSVNSSLEFLFHWSMQYPSWQILVLGTRYNITCTVISNHYYIYINWTCVKDWAYSYTNASPSVINIWQWNWTAERINWCVCEVIVDWEWWDATKALDRAKYLWFAN